MATDTVRLSLTQDEFALIKNALGEAIYSYEGDIAGSMMSDEERDKLIKQIEDTQILSDKLEKH